MTAGPKKIPFSVNREDSRSLLDQVTDGLREAIVCGYYAPGDVLPSSHDLIPVLGVSRIITQNALARLAAEGYITSRVGVRSVVRNRDGKQWRGHVVMVYPWGDDGYFQTVLMGMLRDALAAEGYLFTQACIRLGADGRRDFSALDVALARSVDFAIAIHDDSGIFRKLAERKIPYVAIGHITSSPPGAVAVSRNDNRAAAAAFAASCAKAGTGGIVAVYWTHLMNELVPAFAEVGIPVRKIKVPVDISAGRIVGVERAGRLLFERLVASGRISRDAVYYFADDYLARGALTALSYAGFHTPEDIRVATWSNKGLCPDYPRELSRIEVDPAAVGRETAQRVVSYLRTGRFPEGGVCPRWIPGETLFPPRHGDAAGHAAGRQQQ